MPAGGPDHVRLWATRKVLARESLAPWSLHHMQQFLSLPRYQWAEQLAAELPIPPDRFGDTSDHDQAELVSSVSHLTTIVPSSYR